MQSRMKSVIFWLGLLGVAVQSVLAVLVATGSINQEVSAAVLAGTSALLAYCNGNNPSLSGQY